VGIVNAGVSALTKLAIVVVLAVAFLFGMATVVYMSLQGSVVQVPEIVGKNLSDGKSELASLGLKIQVRASRPTTDAPDTVLEQLPKPGETVKTGQLIVVVTSKPAAQPEETPSTLKKSIDEDDSETIENMISDKPKKKSNSNSNSNKKKADTTRDVLGNTATSDTNTETSDDPDTGKKEIPSANPDKGKEKEPAVKPTVPPAAKPTPGKLGQNDHPKGPVKP
jgi:beta-lactam-binding protein with PASTA domain